MQGTWVIYRRELAGLFLAPLGWVLLFLALFANGLFVYLLLDATRGDIGTVLRSALGGGTLFWALLVFLPPLLAMRMMAEESRTGTLEYLLTAPVADGAVVLGKWLAVARTSTGWCGLPTRRAPSAPRDTASSKGPLRCPDPTTRSRSRGARRRRRHRRSRRRRTRSRTSAPAAPARRTAAGGGGASAGSASRTPAGWRSHPACQAPPWLSVQRSSRHSTR